MTCAWSILECMQTKPSKNAVFFLFDHKKPQKLVCTWIVTYVVCSKTSTLRYNDASLSLSHTHSHTHTHTKRQSILSIFFELCDGLPFYLSAFLSFFLSFFHSFFLSFFLSFIRSISLSLSLSLSLFFSFFDASSHLYKRVCP